MFLVGEDPDRGRCASTTPATIGQPSSNNTSNRVEKGCSQCTSDWWTRPQGRLIPQHDSAAMNLGKKVVEDLHLQHPVRHLSVCKLYSKPEGKREKRQERSSWLPLQAPRWSAVQSLPSKRGPRQSAIEAPETGRWRRESDSRHQKRCQRPS